MVDFKNLTWATSFATRASRKFIYLPYRASGKKSYCHTMNFNTLHNNNLLTTGNTLRQSLILYTTITCLPQGMLEGFQCNGNQAKG